jgi:ADP-ribose pyrophosphatase YjhB (NUDIX family)
MIRKALGDAWKILPRNFRRKVIRITNDRFTVSAAAVIVNEAGEVLLLEHVLRPGTGWGLPGGFLKNGEQPEFGIRREIKEEVGIELGDLTTLRVWTFGPHLEIVFTAVPIGEPAVRTREIYGFNWYSAESLPRDLPSAQKLVIGEVLGRAV